MIDGCGAERDEVVHVELGRSVVSTPGDHVERGMVQRGLPERPGELLHQRAGLLLDLVPRVGHLEVGCVGEPAGADQTQFGQAKGKPVVLADEAPARALRQVYPELDSPWDQGEFTRLNLQPPQFRGDQERAGVRQDQQLPVGIEEEPVGHRHRGPVDVQCGPGLRIRRAVTADREHAVHEILLPGGDLEGIPPHLIRVRRLRERRGGEGFRLGRLVSPVHYRRHRPKHISAPVQGPRSGKGST